MTNAPALVADRCVVLRGDRDIGPLSLRLAAGDVVALVGANGCGKTSALLMLSGLLAPTSGTVEIFGRTPSPSAPPQGVGWLPDRPVFWEWDDALGNLAPFATSQDEALRVLTRLGLPPRGLKVRRFSRGMKQRLGLARALATAPRLLILDEPTIAIDTAGVKDLIELILEHRQDGVAVLLASHDHAFVEALGAAVITLDDGRPR